MINPKINQNFGSISYLLLIGFFAVWIAPRVASMMVLIWTDSLAISVASVWATGLAAMILGVRIGFSWGVLDWAADTHLSPRDNAVDSTLT